MTKSISAESLENKLMSALKSDNLWIQFMECLGAELDLMREHIGEKRYHYNIEKQLEDGLIRIAKTYGYTPNLIIDNSIAMIKKEVESIPFRIRNKTTYDGYYVIFKQIGKIGDIYNYYWSGKKLIKAIKWDAILKVLDNAKSYTEPFLNITPDKNFSTISSADSIYLDTGEYLDDLKGQWNWLLDENVEISPTKHLGIEYYPRSFDDFSDDPKFLLLKKYYQYLSVGVEYNRRLPIVPHCGLQLTSINYEGGGNNYFDPTSEYSIPKLKLNSVLGFEYNKTFIQIDSFNLDGKLGLDEITKWYLDKDVVTALRPTLSDFKYISSGTGSLSTPTSDVTTLFDYSKLVLFYTFGDEDNSTIIRDYSINRNNSKIVGIEGIGGTTKKVKGIIGKTVDFDGVTSLEMEGTIDITDTDLTFGFWFNPNSKDYFDQDIYQNIINSESLSFAYNYKRHQVYYTFGDNLEGAYDVEPNTINNVVFEIDSANKTLKIYNNAKLIVEEDISTTNYLGQVKLYIGANPLYPEENFVGIIDSLWLINKLYSEDNIQKIYSKKLGLITQMGNRLATYELDMQHEGTDNDRWAIIQSHVKANDVTNEFGFFAEKSMNKDVSLVNLFYNGKAIRYEMQDESSSADKYSEFGIPLMQVYLLKSSSSVEYLYSTDKKEKKYYREFTYDSESDIVVLFNQYIVQEEDVIEDTGFQYYSNVTYTRTKLIATTYKGNANFYPIKNEYFSLFYKVFAPNGVDEEIVELKASQDGKFYNKETNKEVTGYINFQTGEYEIGALTERYTTQEILENTSELPKFSTTLQGTPNLFNINNTSEIKKESFFMKYQLGDNVYVARDNGEGLISGIGIYNGTIDYATRTISFAFDTDLAKGITLKGDIIANYTYLESLNMIEDSDTFFNYKVENQPISEIGLEDKNHNLLAYMTFPPVEFDTINNHISAMFIIRKRQ